MLVQKYHSVHEIDEEFLPGIEDLLEGELSSFEEFAYWSKKAPENVHYNIFLFFNPVKNTPVGLAMLQMIKIEDAKKSIFRLKPKSEQKIYLNWKIPGLTGRGILYHPLFEEEVMAEFLKVKEKFESRENVIHEEIVTDSEVLVKSLKGSHQIYPSHSSHVPLVKVHAKVEDYFQMTGQNYEACFERIVSFMKENKINVVPGESIKDIFRNIPGGKDLYLELKDHPKLKFSKKANAYYIGLIKEESVLSILSFIEGKNDFLYHDLIAFNNWTPSKEDGKVFLTMVIDHFYHSEKAKHLICNTSPYSKEILESFGLRLKETWVSAKDISTADRKNLKTTA